VEDLIREYVKDALREEILNEGVYQNIISKIKEKGKLGIKSTKDFFQKLQQEWGETKEGALILKKIVMGNKLERGESAALKQQIKDIAKGVPLFTLLVLPGGGICTVALVKLAKKFGYNLMPSSFLEEDDQFDSMTSGSTDSKAQSSESFSSANGQVSGVADSNTTAVTSTAANSMGQLRSSS